MIVAGSDSEHARTSDPTISALQMNPVDTVGALLDILQGVLDGAAGAGPRLTRARFLPRESTRRG